MRNQKDILSNTKKTHIASISQILSFSLSLIRKRFNMTLEHTYPSLDGPHPSLNGRHRAKEGESKKKSKGSSELAHKGIEREK